MYIIFERFLPVIIVELYYTIAKLRSPLSVYNCLESRRSILFRPGSRWKQMSIIISSIGRQNIEFPRRRRGTYFGQTAYDFAIHRTIPETFNESVRYKKLTFPSGDQICVYTYNFMYLTKIQIHYCRYKPVSRARCLYTHIIPHTLAKIF